MSDWLVVLLAIGTTARLTRLITADSISKPLRDQVELRTQAGAKKRWGWVDELLNCPWCVSMWVGLPTGYIVVLWPDNRFVLGGMVGLTASWVAANVQVREPE